MEEKGNLFSERNLNHSIFESEGHFIQSPNPWNIMNTEEKLLDSIPQVILKELHEAQEII